MCRYSAQFVLLASCLASAACGGPANTSSDEPTGAEGQALTFPISRSIQNAVFGASQATERKGLVTRWAPVHYQDVNKNDYGGRADYITKFNYDGDWAADNNWDNLDWGDMTAHAYVKVAETWTHWFIYYAFYHPRDWAESFAEEHENDCEGILMFVRKDGTQYGTIEGMFTVADENLLPFAINSQFGVPKTGPTEYVQWDHHFADPDGFGHVRTFQACEGHPISACGHQKLVYANGWRYVAATRCDDSEDGIRYVPTDGSSRFGGAAQAPSSVGVWTDVRYDLLDMDELWLKKKDAYPSMWLEAGSFPLSFLGNDSGTCGGWTTTCADNGANPPWAWGPAPSPPSHPHYDWGQDPARYVWERFNFPARPNGWSSTYLKNDFLGCPDLTTARSGPLPARPDGLCDGVCPQYVIGQDSVCAQTWDATCVNEAKSICKLQ
jgi:hypothetical protein